VTQLASRTWHMQQQCANACVYVGYISIPVHADKIFPIRRTLKLVIPLPSQKQADNYGMHAGPVSSTKLVNLFVFANVGLALDALVLDRVNTAMSPLLGSLMMQVTLVELSSCMQHSGEDNGDSGRADHEQASSVWAEGRPCRHQGGSEAVAPHNQARHYR